MAGLLCAFAACASAFDYKFTGAKLSDALSLIADEHPELDLNFIYNELDNYRVSANIHTDDPYDALRQVVGLNPVSVLRKGGRYYLEALQHGTFAYSGRLVATDSEPLPGAAVYILAPRDSSVITYGTTDAEGRFSIPCDHSRVLVKFTCMGYLPRYIDEPSFNMGTLELRSSPVMLKGVKVEADIVDVQQDKTIYLPTFQQKKAASSGFDLLRRMAINQILIDPMSNGVTTNTGQSVQLFINKRPASNADMDGLRMSDVKRVELLESPTDVRFNGANYVINFIVQEYEYGGYTSIRETLSTANSGVSNQPQIISKINVKRMTYDLFVGPDQVDAQHIGTNESSTFNLREGAVEREATFDKGELKYFQIPVTFRALYSTDKTTVSNTFGYTFYDKYHAFNSGSMQMKPFTEKNYSYETVAPYVTRSASWKGMYYFAMPRQWSFDAKPMFNYSHNSQYSDYRSNVDGTTNIVNNAKENAYNARLTLSLSKIVNKKHTFTFTLDGGLNRNEITYTGSTPYRSHLNDLFYALQLRYRLNLSKLTINTDAGLATEHISSKVKSYTDAYPFVHVFATYRLNKKNAFDCYIQFASNTPSNDMISPNVVQSNELLYISGNPDIRTSRHTTVDLSYGFYPNNAFSASAYASYYRNTNRDIAHYSLYDGGRAVLRDWINSGDYNRLQCGINGIVRALDNNFAMQVNVNLNNGRSSGYFTDKATFVGYSAYATYYLGDFNFALYYKSSTKAMMQNGPGYLSNKSFYFVNIGWAKGDWKLSFYLKNFCRTSYKTSRTDIITPVFNSSEYKFNGNSHLTCQFFVSYTFGYGKKIQRQNEVGSQGSDSSAILK